MYEHTFSLVSLFAAGGRRAIDGEVGACCGTMSAVPGCCACPDSQIDKRGVRP